MIDRKIIEELAVEELVDANTKHDPKFNSIHEGYAVIKEELEEMQYEMKIADAYLGRLWECVKNDEDNATVFLEALKKRTISAVQEGIQVVAMCDKALKLY